MPVQSGDIGTVIVIALNVSIADASVLRVDYKKPSGRTGTWSAQAGQDGASIVVVTDGANVSVDERGVWLLQPYLEFTSGWKGHGTTMKLQVGDA